MINLSKKIIRKINIILIFFMITGIGVALAYIGEVKSPYGILIILPIFYFLGYVTYMLVCNERTIDIKIIILGMFFIKLFLFPVLVVCSGEFNTNKMNSLVEDRIFESVMIQLFEWISIITALLFINPKRKGINNDFYSLSIDKKRSKKLWQIMIVCIVIIIIACLKYPALLNKFRPIFFLDESAEIAWRRNSHIAANTMPAIIYYPINWLLSITRFGAVYMLVIHLWKKKTKNNSGLLCFLSFLCIYGGLTVIVPDDVAASIMAAVSLNVLLVKLYPEKKKHIVRIISIFGILLFAYMFIIIPFTSQTNTVDALSRLSRKINAYFSGTINVSGAVLMECNNKLEYFMGDFLRSLPVLRGFFVSYPRSTELFNTSLGLDMIYNSQIIPLEGQAYFYFGYLGVFIIPYLIVYCCMKFYEKMIRTESSYSFFIYCFFTLLTGIGIVTYDTFLIFALFLSYIPLIVLDKLFIKKGKV